MVTYAAVREDIRVHSSLVFQDERSEQAVSDDGYGLNGPPFGFILYGSDMDNDVEIFVQQREV